MWIYLHSIAYLITGLHFLCSITYMMSFQITHSICTLRWDAGFVIEKSPDIGRLTIPLIEYHMNTDL